MWVRCDDCSRWRKLPMALRDEPELLDDWTCEAGAHLWGLNLACWMPCQRRDEPEQGGACERDAPDEASRPGGSAGGRAGRLGGRSRGRWEVEVAEARVQDEHGVWRAACGTPGCPLPLWHKGVCAPRLEGSERVRSRKPSAKVLTNIY